jgi:hypothetical protein
MVKTLRTPQIMVRVPPNMDQVWIPRAFKLALPQCPSQRGAVNAKDGRHPNGCVSSLRKKNEEKFQCSQYEPAVTFEGILYHTCFFVQCRFSMWISSCPGLRSAHLTTDRFVRPAGPKLNTVLSKYYWKTVCNNVTCDKMENTNGRKTLTLRCCQKKEHNGW